MLKLPDLVERELKATGRPYRVEMGKLAKVYIDDQYIGSLRHGRGTGPDHALKNFIANVKRFRRQMQGLS